MLLSPSLLKEKQQKAIDRLYEHDETILIAPTGSGKTIICLSAVAELKRDGAVEAVVVACPAKVVPVWAKEAAKWEHTQGLRVVALEGSPEHRLKLMSAGADVFVLSLNNLEWFIGQKHGCNGIIIDELSRAAGKQTRRLYAKAGDVFTWRVGMTATPVAENFEKLFKMARIIDNGAALGRSIESYLNKYFFSDYMGYNYTLLEGADRLILDALKHLIHVVKDEKREELPELHEKTLWFDMPETTLDIYKDMKRHFCADGVEAVNEAVKSGKLRQIGSGFLYKQETRTNNRGEPVLFNVVDEWLDTARLGMAKAWMSYCSQHKKKGVIFYEYNAQYEQLKTVDEDCEFITGGMDKSDTRYALERFIHGDADFLVAQINAMSHGVDGLQDVCSRGLFYHPMWSRDAKEQAIGRLWRTGQTEPVTISTLVCRQSLDPLVLQRVDGKGEFMEMFKAHLKEY